MMVAGMRATGPGITPTIQLGQFAKATIQPRSNRVPHFHMKLGGLPVNCEPSMCVLAGSRRLTWDGTYSIGSD